MRVQLAGLLQQQNKFVEAAELYSQVKGDPEFTFTAKFKAAECYYAELQGASAKDNKGPKIDTESVRKLALENLNEAIKMGPEAERTASGTGKKTVHEIRGEAIYMLASILEEDPEKVDYAQVATLLNGYESQYPSMNAKFQDVAEWRITALDHLGKYDDVNTDVAAIVERSKGNIAKGDFIKELGIDFWKAAQEAKANNNQTAYKKNAMLTATAYKFFADMVASGKIPVKNLTGTLSIYGQALQATDHEQEAEKVYQEVVKADPASPDANAGLARIAQAKKDWKDAVTLWTTVESTAAESDILWYEAKYNIAVIYNEQGNTQGACSKLAQTRAEHPTLGSPEMKTSWDALQRKICLDNRK
jgi:lipopolysaccharide biosynthesis regulator YciM